MSKVQGTVKWFSNKKGFGFITPGEGSPTTEDIFVHQSSILSEGYRTLDEGWAVEFTIGTDEGERLKAENVTGVGGGPCTGPSSRQSRDRRRRTKNADGEIPAEKSAETATETKEEGQEGTRSKGRGRGRGRGPRGRSGANKEPKDTSTFWHNSLSSEVKDAIVAKGVRVTTGTIDVSLGQTRIKLGTGGYASMANADGTLAEGTFTCEADGQAKITLDKVIAFVGDEWKTKTTEECGLPVSFSLCDDAVGNVKPDETALTLWGDKPSDPRAALEANGFLMRRVVLTPKGSR